MASHESVVQALPSSQLRVPVGLHRPAAQMSPVVHASPSLQVAVLAVWVQPLLASQPSLVHGFLSSQLGAAPPLQMPAAQMSPVVQALPSSQVMVTLLCTQPVTLSQLSAVQGLLSSQLTPLPATHAPPAQMSPLVQALPSLQVAVLLLWAQPSLASHESLVQGLLSSQLGAAPPLHTPLAQVSPVVQALPSSHAAVVLLNTQPVVLSQVSAVHKLLSLQASALPGLHTPPPHTSPLVQALPSLQVWVLAAWAQPAFTSHESLVHALLSSQLGAAPPLQLPAVQVSPSVHALASSQAAVLLAWTQPVLRLQLSSVQALLSSQLGAAPPLHAL